MNGVLAAGLLGFVLIPGTRAAPPGAQAPTPPTPALPAEASSTRAPSTEVRPAAARSVDAPPAATFTLSATASNFANYYPTYLANGYWSMASSLLGTAPTPAQMVGVMDYTAGDVSRPAAIPSWNEIDYFDGADWLNTGPATAQSHTRYRQTLDMRSATLSTRYRWRSRGRVTDVSVISFVSQSDPHVAAVALRLTPRFSGTVRLRFTLRPPPAPQRLALADMSAAQFAAAAAAAHRPELAAGGRRDAIWYLGQIDVTAMGSDAHTNTLWMEGKAIGGRVVALGAAISLPPGFTARHRAANEAGGATLEATGEVRRGNSYAFTKFVVASADGWPAGSDRGERRNAAAALRARRTGFGALRAAHEAKWRALWRSDIVVGGSAELQRTLHSDLFYLLENSAPDTSWPAAACGFSGNYFGHVFWDNDLWVFPALLLLHPQRAKSLIAFRARTLPQALARAKARGLAGAMYPWEADPWSGEDVTPKFAAENADREIHVNGAVALAQWQYYLASGDRAWLRERAYPVIKAVADYWVSRATYDSAARRFEILDVTSPEEDYTHVNNEIYTNVVARRSLEAAMRAAAALGLAPGPQWSIVAEGLYLPTTAENGRYFDFDPTTPHDKTGSWMATSVPMLSIPALDFDTDSRTRQGLLRHSLEAVEPIRGRANQMVLVMLAIQAAAAGDTRYFSDLIVGRGGTRDPFLKPPFNVRSETPQNDSVYLLATSGGFIQSLVFGLSGLRIAEQGLVARFPPSLPQQLRYLELRNIAFRGKTLQVGVRRLPSGRVVRTIEGGIDRG
ncbi:MAG: glycoside hydrolase family 65 protein [Pseudomonadota bacterium]|nr:glycoside hydrolase family 65 protein [Pseudomonadota bacterium]